MCPQVLYKSILYGYEDIFPYLIMPQTWDQMLVFLDPGGECVISAPCQPG